MALTCKSRSGRKTDPRNTEITCISLFLISFIYRGEQQSALTGSGGIAMSLLELGGSGLIRHALEMFRSAELGGYPG